MQLSELRAKVPEGRASEVLDALMTIFTTTEEVEAASDETLLALPSIRPQSVPKIRMVVEHVHKFGL